MGSLGVVWFCGLFSFSWLVLDVFVFVPLALVYFPLEPVVFSAWVFCLRPVCFCFAVCLVFVVGSSCFVVFQGG